MPFDVEVIVTNQDGQQARGTCTVIEAPIIESITPASGPIAGGYPITISGRFLNPKAIEFNGRPGRDVTVTADGTSAKCIVPDLR